MKNPLKFLCRTESLGRRLEQSRPRLYRMAFAWTQNPALADDLVQETLAKALHKSGQLRDPAALNTWLFSILSNCWRDHFRRNRETEDIDNVVLLHEDTPEHRHDDRQVVDRVRGAIARLPEGQRQVVTLVDLEGFTYMEVATILDIPIGTVMSRLCRAHNALRACLLREFDRDPAAAQARFRRIK
jgi:RNA polymerase sigma-70 factor (ECF subfamily)